MDRASVELTVQFLQKMTYLHLVTGASRLLCEAMEERMLPQTFTDEVELAVSEACTNAIRHAAADDPAAMVTVRFRADETRLVVEVSDQGAGFDFEEIPLPAFDRHPEGGYGLYIIRRTMDEVRYTRGSERNTLTMIKYFRIKGESPP
jgi:serine/threonine-protein kinase RsbW